MTRRHQLPAAVGHTIQIESAGNARIIDRTGEVIAVLEDWRLWVNGQDVGEVSNYHEAMEKTALTV